MKILKFNLILFLCLLSSCTQLIEWNPVINGLVFDKEISFNYKNIIVNIKKSGFINSFIGPQIELSMTNFTKDTLSFSPKDFFVLINKDVIKNGIEYPNTMLFLPNQKFNYIFYSEFRTEGLKIYNGKRYYFNDSARIFLEFPNFLKNGKTAFKLPSIEFRPKETLNFETFF